MSAEAFYILFGKSVKSKLLAYLSTKRDWTTMSEIVGNCRCSRRSVMSAFSEWKESGILMAERKHGRMMYKLHPTVKYSLQEVSNAVKTE